MSNNTEQESFWNLKNTVTAIAVGVSIIGIVLAAITVAGNLDEATIIDNRE